MRYLSIPSEHLQNQTSTCFILHGLGDTGYGWAHIGKLLSRKFPFTKFILPHARKRRITRNNGQIMPAWYNSVALKPDAPEDKIGILQSAQEILKIVALEESNGIPRTKIVMGGFSQGGAMALAIGLLFKNIDNSSQEFGGIMALSTYLPIKDHFINLKDEIPVKTPIYMSHGTDDKVISYDWGHSSKNVLVQDLKCENVDFETLPRIRHTINEKVVESMTNFLKRIFD